MGLGEIAVHRVRLHGGGDKSLSNCSVHSSGSKSVRPLSAPAGTAPLPVAEIRMQAPIAVPQATARFDVLRWLPEEVRAAFARTVRLRRYEDGQLIYAQGDSSTEMFRVLSGRIQASLIRADGRQFIYTVYQPGDCFGACTMVDGGSRPQTTEALGHVEVQVLNQEGFNGFRKVHREFDNALLHLTCSYARVLCTYFADALLDELPSRLAYRLLEGAKPAKNGQLMAPLSQSSLGAMLGVSRQTVNKLLNEFENDGSVSLTYGGVIIRDLRSLERYADARLDDIADPGGRSYSQSR
jgi:CRP/FNR family cyclic AMP-dependent transcriptional regulator